MPRPVSPFPDLATSPRPQSAWFPPPTDYGTSADAVNPSELPDGWNPEGASLISGGPDPVQQFQYNLGLRALKHQADAEIQGNRIMDSLNGVDLTTPQGLSGYEAILKNNPRGAGTPGVQQYLASLHQAKGLAAQARNAPLDQKVQNFLAGAYNVDWSDPDAVQSLKQSVTPEMFSDPRVPAMMDRLVTHQQGMALKGNPGQKPMKPLSVNEEKMLVDRSEKADAEDVGDDLKTAYLKSKGIDPTKATPEQWTDAYNAKYFDTPQRKSTRTLLQNLVQSGREISPILLHQFGLDENGAPSQVATPPPPRNPVSVVPAGMQPLPEPTGPLAHIEKSMQQERQAQAKTQVDKSAAEQQNREAATTDLENAKKQIFATMTPADLPALGAGVTVASLVKRIGKHLTDVAFTTTKGTPVTWGQVAVEAMRDPETIRLQQEQAVGPTPKNGLPPGVTVTKR